MVFRYGYPFIIQESVSIVMRSLVNKYEFLKDLDNDGTIDCIDCYFFKIVNLVLISHHSKYPFHNFLIIYKKTQVMEVYLRCNRISKCELTWT